MQNANYVWKFIKENCYSFHICFVISTAAAIESPLLLRLTAALQQKKKFLSLPLKQFASSFFLSSLFFIDHLRSSTAVDHILMWISHASMPQQRSLTARLLSLLATEFLCSLQPTPVSSHLSHLPHSETATITILNIHLNVKIVIIACGEGAKLRVRRGV